jgi:hypothetical protein
MLTGSAPVFLFVNETNNDQQTSPKTDVVCFRGKKYLLQACVYKDTVNGNHFSECFSFENDHIYNFNSFNHNALWQRKSSQLNKFALLKAEMGIFVCSDYLKSTSRLSHHVELSVANHHCQAAIEVFDDVDSALLTNISDNETDVVDTVCDLHTSEIDATKDCEFTIDDFTFNDCCGAGSKNCDTAEISGALLRDLSENETTNSSGNDYDTRSNTDWYTLRDPDNDALYDTEFNINDCKGTNAMYPNFGNYSSNCKGTFDISYFNADKLPPLFHCLPT